MAMKREEAEKRLEAMKDAEWVTRIATLSNLPPGEDGEVVACGLNPDRYDELHKKPAEMLPDRLRNDDLSQHELKQMSARVFLAMTKARRAEALERVVPGKARSIESALSIIHRRPLSVHYGETIPCRVRRGELFETERAAWLGSVLREVGPYSASLPELAGMLSHMQQYGSTWPWLFAGAIEAGGKEGEQVLRTLIACVNGEHETGEIDGQVIKALLCSSRAEAWEAVERLLLAAQRQEGLRQSILESMDEAHPEAFVRMCRLILEHDLCRFSSVVRAADVWFGLLWDSAARKVVEESIELALRFLEKPAERARAIDKGEPAEAYFALWAAGFEDLEHLLDLAPKAFASKDPLKRWAGIHALARLELDEVAPLVLRGLSDDDLRIAARAARYFQNKPVEEGKPVPLWSGDAFNALEKLLARVPGKSVKLKPALWPWTGGTLEAATIVSGMLAIATGEQVARLLPHASRLSVWERQSLARSLGGVRPQRWHVGRAEWPTDETPPPISEDARRALVGLLTDGAAGVVEAAAQGLHNRPIAADELAALRTLLKRKAAAVRTIALRRALQLDDDRLLAFASDLLEGAAEQRAGGLELLKSMVEAGRAKDRAVEAARAWVADRGKLTKAEEQAARAVTEAGAEKPRRDNAFGLINPANLTRPEPARALPMLRMTDAAWNVLASLARFVMQNKDFEIPPNPDNRYEREPTPLGAESLWRLSQPKHGNSLDAEWSRCPVAHLLNSWLENRDPDTRDPDGLELLRAKLALDSQRVRCGRFEDRLNWPEKILKREESRGLRLKTLPQAGYEYLLTWLVRLQPKPQYATVLIDSIEASVASEQYRLVHDDELEWPTESAASGKPEENAPLAISMTTWHERAEWLERQGIIEFAPADFARIWRLALLARPGARDHWSKLSPSRRERRSNQASSIAISPSAQCLVEAICAGQATHDDLFDFAIHPYWSDDRGRVQSVTVCREFSQLDEDSYISDREDAEIALRTADMPAWNAAVARLRNRLIDLEIARGDAPTEASPMIGQVQFAGHADACIRCLAALGDRALRRNQSWSDESRQANLTHLVSVTLPAQDDTPEKFAALARAANLSDDTLISLAVFTPQWVRHVEHALGKDWAGFEDAVWWIHAHTKDSEYRVNSALRKKWQAAIAERTPLAPDELKDGAVDVAWFLRIHEQLGENKWARVYDCAKFACSGIGHKRAQLFADAMLNRKGATERELTARIKSKRHQDSIRALGLVPLKSGDAGRSQVLARYKVMQEIRRTSRKHGGSMLQASEKRAVEIGMENLARAAGYPDPLRLQWAMEKVDLADLAKGPVTLKAGDVSVTLSITDDGEPEATAKKAGKPLASVPASAKKNEKIAELSKRATELRRAGSRMRQALEQAMCRGDEFTGAEVADLAAHPILWPLLRRLVLVADSNSGARICGYPDKGGKVLRAHNADLEPLKASDTVRIAHPLDLLARKDWHLWQRECFSAERVQPFKQVFREVYVPVEAEGGKAVESLRYQGHQVQPRQALALLGSRGWINRAEEGVQKTYYKERLTARLAFEEHFYTPAEVEGLTLRSLLFTKAGKHEPVALPDVPPRVFSESMRDLDLVVSVAHRGGVDPEASRSTLEMRAALVRETAALLKLDNVAIDGSRVSIKGERAEYSIHLGSASVHVLPGGQVWIVPIAAEHRGRLFLPFADSDPKTAEVMSKVILLARDSDIKDPRILDQIRQLV